MAKGIITVTPKSPGTLKVTEVDHANPYGILVGQLLSFDKPDFVVKLNDEVEFTVLTKTGASVTKVMVPAL